MTRILIVLDSYLPGFKGGGPIRSIHNMVDRFGGDYEFYIVTRDRDRGDFQPYPGVQVNTWLQVGKARVYYLGSRGSVLSRLRALINEVQPDFIYLNSFFSRLTIRVLALRYIGLLSKKVVVLAPRGELAATQLAQKPHRKRVYLALVRRAGLYRDILWQASSRSDIPDIQRVMGKASRIHVAQNLTMSSDFEDSGTPAKLFKPRGDARIVFLSMIRPLKNLHFALDALARVKGCVDFDIYGPVGDAAYWRACREKIARMPSNVRVRYLGPIEHEHVPRTLAGYHFFLLPTLGETFGHVIVEALSAGCPLIISDRTQWGDLASRSAGWALPLDDLASWVRVLQECVDMDDETHHTLHKGAKRLIVDWSASPEREQATVELFLKATRANRE